MANNSLSLLMDGVSNWCVNRTLNLVTGSSRTACPMNQRNVGSLKHTTAGHQDLVESNTLSTVKNCVRKMVGLPSAEIPSIWWEGWSQTFKPHFHLLCSHCTGDDLVVRVMLSQFGRDVFFHSDMLVTPEYPHCEWRDLHWCIPRALFPLDGCVFAVDFCVFSKWGKLLHIGRRLGHYPGS